MNIEEASKIINANYAESTRPQYLSALEKGLVNIKSSNVYDIYERIDELYDINKTLKSSYLQGFFSHLKVIYEKMSEAQKNNVRPESYEKLKQYAVKDFYTTSSVQGEEVADATDEDEAIITVANQQGKKSNKNEVNQSKAKRKTPPIVSSKSTKGSPIEPTIEQYIEALPNDEDMSNVEFLAESNVEFLAEEEPFVKSHDGGRSTLDNIQLKKYMSRCDYLLNKSKEFEENFKGLKKEIELNRAEHKKEIDSNRAEHKKDIDYWKGVVKMLVRQSIKDEDAREFCMHFMNSQ